MISLSIRFGAGIALAAALIGGSLVAAPPAPAQAAGITVPAGRPYLSYSANVSDQGVGTGNSAYINVHDAKNNALSFGIQSDKGAPQSKGGPYYIFERVQNGKFTYQYLAPASRSLRPVTIKWWATVNVAVLYAGTTPIAKIPVTLVPRLFFNAEGNARLQGDVINSYVTNVQIAVGDRQSRSGLAGAWNTKSFNFHGLRAISLNSSTQNGASFKITGRATGLAAGHNWDTDLVAGIAMIAQRWTA